MQIFFLLNKYVRVYRLDGLMQDTMPIEEKRKKERKSRNIPENSFLYQYKYTCCV
jgi:hypothetical protein